METDDPKHSSGFIQIFHVRYVSLDHAPNAVYVWLRRQIRELRIVK